MAVLASITGKTTFESAEISVPGSGALQLFVTGSLGPRGRVLLLLKGADGAFHHYPELTLSRRAAIELQAQAGDKVKLKFVACIAAGAELRQ